MEYRKVSAVKEFNQYGYKWYPSVYCERSLISDHPHYTKPESWIEHNCPEGFNTPQAAIVAGKHFTGEY